MTASNTAGTAGANFRAPRRHAYTPAPLEPGLRACCSVCGGQHPDPRRAK